MKSSLSIPLFLALATVSTAASASPIVLDMEGIAAPGRFAEQRDTQVPMQGFYMNITRGSFYSSELLETASGVASNGTDIFRHSDVLAPFSIEKADEGSFTIQSFDATVYILSYNGFHEFNFDIEVTGRRADGGIVEETFTVDDQDPFETFLFGPAWTNLTEVMFINPRVPAGPGVVLPPTHNGMLDGSVMAYDNIVVVPASIVALSIPPTALLFVPALAGLVTIRRIRRRN